MDLKPVQRLPLFQELSPQRLSQLFEEAYPERYAKGAVLFQQGERAEAIWIVLKGWVHLVRAAEDAAADRSTVIFTITPDEALCGISAIDAGVYNLGAVAATDCEVVRIPGGAFRQALKQEPEFAYQAVRLCARRMRHIAEQYGSMAEPVSQRIIRAILRLRGQFGSTLPMTHRELAQMSWTTTESAIRIVRGLKRRGYLSGGRGRLTIGDARGLAQLLKQRNGVGASRAV